MKTDENLAREIRALEKKLKSLEEMSIQSSELESHVGSNADGPNSPSQILKRINTVQNLIDQIEIEIDKLEMRVSAIEHMGFRLRTGSQ